MTVGVGVGEAVGCGATDCTAANASILPEPKVLSAPGAPKSTADIFNILEISDGVRLCACERIDPDFAIVKFSSASNKSAATPAA